MTNVKNPLTNMIKNYILALLLFNLCSCATTHIVPVPPIGFVPNSIDIGDKVEVVTFDNDIHTFKVTKIDTAGIGSSTEFFAYADIKSMEVRQASDAGPYTMLVLGAIIIGAVVAGAAAGGAKDAGAAVGCIFGGKCQ